MQLSWQPGFSLSRKPVKKPTARRNKRKASNNAQQFEFIAEYPVENHGARHSPSVTSPMHSGEPDEPTAERQASPDLNGTSQSLASYSPKNKKKLDVPLCQMNM
jgi:hypothetical protein